MNAIRPVALGLWVTGGAGMVGNMLVRRNCYMWRDELIEGVKAGFYQPLSLQERHMIHECTRDPKTALEPIDSERAFGMRAVEDFVSPEERDFILSELQVALDRYGRGLSAKDIDRQRAELEQAGVDASFLDGVRYISDWSEDARVPKGIWGCGDALSLRQLPPIFRCLSARVTEMVPNIGRLRHVYVMHSPTGQLYMPPRFMQDFAGHEYVIIPLAHKERETLQGGEVITMSPRQRSQVSSMQDVVKSSWTDKDQDLFAPFRSLARVYATARFRCNFGIRPTKHFGDASNPLPLDPKTLKAKYPNVAPGAWGSDGTSVQTPMEAAGMRVDKIGRRHTWWSKLLGIGNGGDELSINARLADIEDRDPEVALIMLCFEGPINESESRNELRRWEWCAYGRKPRPSDFERMDTEPMISKEEIGDGMVPLIMFMAQNIFKIGRSSEMPDWMMTEDNYFTK
eukprot:CAMPEP_0174849012 /NCGR_PEP_ID=MMETSP1114-20130205/13854_1 /TAXON_ID=312471 /ORGANISM="Neobodo designis, Strain CCAP 1951/1" /LENGTH=456 /DNA_ID=CAMNT_0016083321 /DNA_START=27 /DNA_END=1397 /DNA_ORIENTATION=-